MAPTTRTNEEGKIEYRCHCRIRCKQPTWLPKSTYYSHQKLLDREGQTAAAARKRASGHSSEPELSVNDIQASAKRARTSLGSQDDPEMDEDGVDGRVFTPPHDLASSPMPFHSPPRSSVFSQQDRHQPDALPAPHSRPWEDVELAQGSHDPGADPTGTSSHDTLPDRGSFRDPSLDDDEDPEPSENEQDNPVFAMNTRIKDLETVQQFIGALKAASLEADLPPAILERLRNPPQQPLELNNAAEQLSIEIYLGLENASQRHYDIVRNAILRYDPTCEMLSFEVVKRRVEEISGIVPVYHDMCINSCIGFTGPFQDLERCPVCSKHRYDQVELEHSGKKIPVQQFLTNCMGPAIQAMWRSRDGAEAMSYRRRCTEKILEQITQQDGRAFMSELEDYVHGSDYISAVLRGDIGPDDTVLMLSLDDAQLYRNKASNVWIYIWVLMDRSPDNRYKKRNVYVGGVVPGPNKPKNVDSFIFPGFRHLAALMKEGLTVWNGATEVLFRSDPYIIALGADQIGMTQLNGLVGHHGRFGCRLYCPFPGRRKNKPGGHYFQAAQLPHNYHVVNSDHPDTDVDRIIHETHTEKAQRYNDNLQRLLSQSRSQAAYERIRLETGISKPSIISGFPLGRTLGVPGAFQSDLFHLGSINAPDLHIPLLRGSFECDDRDSKDTWDWAIFRDNALWEQHGREVASVRPYLPGSFDRPPRNIAEKLNSGYKAIEFQNYLYGLAPALLYGLLPEKYWRHLCKLVHGMRIIHQRRLTQKEVVTAHKLLVDWSQEFETLYCQRMDSRLHFARPTIHGPVHLGPETLRRGPYSNLNQAAMERTIGNLGQDIRQHSNVFANLQQIALRRCQFNAVKAMFPAFSPEPGPPRGAVTLGDGYILLRAAETTQRAVSEAEGAALRQFVQVHGVPASDTWLQRPKLARWARLHLPNGQNARSLWKESLKTLEALRTSRNVKFMHDGIAEYGEVRFFFQMEVEPGQPARAFALLSRYTRPDLELLTKSVETVWSCRASGDDDIQVIDVKAISAVVAMVPHPRRAGHDELIGRVFVMEKLGIDSISLYEQDEDLTGDGD